MRVQILYIVLKKIDKYDILDYDKTDIKFFQTINSGKHCFCFNIG